MLSQVRSVSSGHWIHFEFPMTLIRLIDYPLIGEGARNIYDPANDMPADYIVKAVGGNVHRNAVIVSDSPRILGVLATSGRRDIPLRYALWTEERMVGSAGFADVSGPGSRLPQLGYGRAV